MNAANTLIETLVKAGVDKMFSLSGNQIMSIYDASIGSGLEIIHARHEAGAVFMADGYARTSGKIGACLVTAAPGFANALGPLFSVRKTQTPLLLLSGDSPVSRDGMGAFQELDQPQVSSGLTKESWRCGYPERLAEEITGAVRLARSGRPGPVHIALPEDILTGEAGNAGEAIQPDTETNPFDPEPMPLGTADLHAIMSHLEDAKAPLIITGPSLSESRQPELVRKLRKCLGIPVIAMQSPRGLNDPTLGNLRPVLKAADMILLIDKDIDFTLGFADPDHIGAEKLIVIAAEAESIARANNLVSGRLVWGCLADPITTVNTLCKGVLTSKHDVWRKKVDKAIADRPDSLQVRDGFSSPVMIGAIAKHIEGLDSHPLLIIDGGEIGQWAQAGLPTEHMHTNGLSGGIGGSIPQAIGAAFANPGRQVIAIMGDGTAGFHFMEIEIARRWKLPITFIIGNDRRWGAEVEIQKNRYGGDRAIGCMLDDKTRYDTVAKGLGAKGTVVEDAENLAAALDKAAKTRGPTVIDARIEGLGAPVFK